VCNDLVVPFVLRHRLEPASGLSDMGAFLLNVRRIAIFAILLFAYAYYRMVADTAALASIGLLSFAAVAQFAPAFFGGLVWRRATARGAIAGILAGISVWAYTLLLPSLIASGWVGTGLLEHGPLGLTLLRPQVLFFLEFDPLTHGVFWSLFANFGAFVGVSLLRQPEPIERLQANIFVNPDFSGPGPSFRLGARRSRWGIYRKQWPAISAASGCCVPSRNMLPPRA
jgi:Na+/proline symporter